MILSGVWGPSSNLGPPGNCGLQAAIFTLLCCVSSFWFLLFEALKRSVKIRNLSFFSLFPGLRRQRLKLCFCRTLDLYHFYFLKGYLRYKTISSQNGSSEAQIKNFLISWKNYVPFSRYSSFCIFNHPMIYRIYDVTMSFSTRNKVHFWIYLLNHNSYSHQTWPIDRYEQGQWFSVIF